jgi:hypothetical protein
VIGRQAHIVHKFNMINLLLAFSSAHLKIFSLLVLIDVEMNISDKLQGPERTGFRK